ncbi:basic-leucine zipper transcription factor [Phycomyces blakesleeanus]
MSLSTLKSFNSDVPKGHQMPSSFDEVFTFIDQNESDEDDTETSRIELNSMDQNPYQTSSLMGPGISLYTDNMFDNWNSAQYANFNAQYTNSIMSKAPQASFEIDQRLAFGPDELDKSSVSIPRPTLGNPFRSDDQLNTSHQRLREQSDTSTSTSSVWSTSSQPFKHVDPNSQPEVAPQRALSGRRNSAPSKRKRSKEVEDEGETERRQNLLERNRQAALKCRQRKKEWIAQLQANDIQSAAENSALRRQIAIYREEILSLKTMLVAHAHCPLSTSQNTPGNSVLDMICTTPNSAGSHYR